MRLLVAEDAAAVTLDAMDTFLKTEGFDTLLAKDGKEALSLWESSRPYLVCLDIMMPQMDGFEVCRRIRKRDDAIPILFLSAKNEEVDVLVGLEMGADDFIRKPFGKRELLAGIRAALRRQEAGANTRPAFVMAHLTVYLNELRAEIEGEGEIELSSREVAIIPLLHEHVGEAVHRDALLGARLLPRVAHLGSAHRQDP
jgi:two-component system, OmpR family, alkaline phosphatase synthesis response regulator PhoP